jgi:hypothetical protein
MTMYTTEHEIIVNNAITFNQKVTYIMIKFYRMVLDYYLFGKRSLYLVE